MRPTTRQVIDALDERARAEEQRFTALPPDEQRRRLGEFMLAIGPEAGALIHLLSTMQGGRRVLELGTGVGYGTLWLAEAARAHGGRVTSVETRPDKLAAAMGHLADCALLEQVELRQADAIAFVAEAPGPWDLVVIDVWKEAYVPCFERLLGKLAPGALVIADNMHRPVELRPLMREYQRVARSAAGCVSFELPVGNGLELTRRLP